MVELAEPTADGACEDQYLEVKGGSESLKICGKNKNQTSECYPPCVTLGMCCVKKGRMFYLLILCSRRGFSLFLFFLLLVVVVVAILLLLLLLLFLFQ